MTYMLLLRKRKKVLDYTDRKKSYAKLTKIYNNNKSFIHNNVKDKIEHCAGFAAIPQNYTGHDSA